MESPEAKFEGILEAAPDAMVVVDGSGRIIVVNSQTEKVFGYKRDELLGQPIEMLVPDRYRGGHPGKRDAYSNNPKTRPMGAGLDLFARRKDGTEFAAEISLSPVETSKGKLVTAAIRDITARKQEAQERNRKMEEASRMKSEFLANMSHELRTPLNAIIGFSTLLHTGRAGALSDTQKEYLGDILSSSHHLLQLINDILDLAKIEAGKMEFNAQRVDPAKLANEVKDTLRGLAAEKQIELALNVDPSLSSVTIDPRMLKQVLYNFLSNALKFTLERGSVAVRILPEGPHFFRLEVKDTGIGIKPEDLSRLFVEFQQLDSGTSKKHAGTGLGLALTKRLVEAQGGTVSVESQVGRGSVFSVVLPRNPK
jgi:PAS domain S-box-containing protein